MAFVNYNPNPMRKSVGDCVIRAISTATDKDWDSVYMELMLKGFDMKDIPIANNVWGSYLHDLGFKKEVVPDTCPDCYTVIDFINDNPHGTYVLGTGSHAIAVKDGKYFDTWDSGEEVPVYYWKKEGK